MMTPELIRGRLLKAKDIELQRIVSELRARPPVNAAALIEVCDDVQQEIRAEARRLQARQTPSDDG